ncbi:MAG TPA: hypothetical protein VIO36_04845 [Anaerolineaceae bacterium]
MIATGHKYTSALLLLFAIVITIILRWNFSHPTQFIEGDDAAIAAGLARLCVKADIGPYYFHAPKIDNAAYQQYQQTGNTSESALDGEYLSDQKTHPFYRYDSMTGVYFLGSRNCSWGDAASRLLFLCFLAGTFFPLFLALFFERLFRPLPSLFLPICYLSIALSPEQWVSGSAYINDKILAMCFLAFALWLLVSVPEKKLSRYAVLGLAGISIGLSCLMRFDSILFLPLVFLVVLAQSPKINPKYVFAQIPNAIFTFAFSVTTYLSVMWTMKASIANALQSGANAGISFQNWYVKLRIIFVAFGWGQVIIALMTLGILSVYLANYLIRTKSDRKTSFHVTSKGILHLINSKVSVKSLSLVILFLFVEPIFLFSFPFSSTKYVLLSSALFTTLWTMVAFRLWQEKSERIRSGSFKRLDIYAFLFIMVFLPPLSGFIELRHIHSSDGVRYMGGWFLHAAQPNEDAVTANRIMDCFSKEMDDFGKHVLVKTPSWVLEESIAYEAANRGWQNRVIPLSAFIENPEENTKMHFTLNQYLFPGTEEFGISVTSDYDVYTYKDLLTEQVFEESFGSNYIFYEDMACAFP